MASGIVVQTARLMFANPTAQTFSGALSGKGAMTKIGAGTMVLSGTAISFNGNVTVSAGTLVAYNAVAADSLGSSTGYGAYSPNPSSIGPTANTITVNSGAVLEMYGDTTSRMVHVRQLHGRRQHFAGHHRRDVAGRQRPLPEDGQRRPVALRRPQLQQRNLGRSPG